MKAGRAATRQGTKLEAMNKTVVITGGVKGIGRAIALKLAQQSYNLVLNFHRDKQSAEDTLRCCREYTDNVMLFQADVSRPTQVAAMMDTAVHTFHSLDVLINNAGVNIDRMLLDMTEEDWDVVVDTNMKGVFLCAQAAARFMLRQGSGLILNLGASTGIRGRANGINYCASKAGVMVMTKCLALELAPTVRVNCLLPGMARTDELVQRYQLNDPDKLRQAESTIPLQRVCEPDEVAEVAAFLLSDAARYINGQKIIVDGGQFMF
jgi:NAD(P)-dependent dehydrogenase (short-subunit alcohol dehydrogenase family)